MRNRYLLLADLPLIAVCALGAFALRFDLVFFRHRPEFTAFLVVALLIKPLVFVAFGMYGRYWAYASAQDLLAVTLAVSDSSVVLTTAMGAALAFGVVDDFSRQVLLIDWLLTLGAAGGVRMSVRVISDAHRKARKARGERIQKRVLIVGAGEAGALVTREIVRNPQLGLQAIGFLDDAREKHGKL